MNKAFTFLYTNIRQSLLIGLALLGCSWAATGQTPTPLSVIDFNGSSDTLTTNFNITEQSATWNSGGGVTNSDMIIPPAVLASAPGVTAIHTNRTLDFSTPGRQYILSIWTRYTGVAPGTGSGRCLAQLALVNLTNSVIGTSSNVNPSTNRNVSLAYWWNSWNGNANNGILGDQYGMRSFSQSATTVGQNSTLCVWDKPIQNNPTYTWQKTTAIFANIGNDRVRIDGYVDGYTEDLSATMRFHTASPYVMTNHDICTNTAVYAGFRSRHWAGQIDRLDNFELDEAPAPLAPTQNPLALGDGYTIVNWTYSRYAVSHKVYRATSEAGPYDLIATVGITNLPNTFVTNANFTSYKDTGLALGNTYYYYVTAANLNESVPSTTNSIRYSPPVQNLVAVGGTNQISLSWSPVFLLGGATNYIIYRSEVSGGPYAAVGTNSSGATVTFVDTGLQGGKPYYYYVQGTMAGGVVSGASSEATAYTAAAIPANLLAEIFTATALRIGWTTSDTIPATTIVEVSSDGVSFSPLAVGTNCTPTSGPHRFGNVSHFYLSGLTPNTIRYFRAYATNAVGFSPRSAIVSATTFATAAININFCEPMFPTYGDWPIPGYFDDYGLVYSLKTNGFTYGWSQDNTANANTRGFNGSDERYRTYNQMFKTNSWAISLPNGLYQVHLSGGDPNGPTSSQFNLQGSDTGLSHPDGLFGTWWVDLWPTVSVTDGTLTISNGYAVSNNRLQFLDIYPATPAANPIITQPQSQSVIENAKAELSVMVSGGPTPFGYQWYSNTVAVPGANRRTYTIPAVATSDAASYYVAVTNAGASVNSSVAVLTVTPRTAPVLLAAGSLDGTTVGLAFDEALDAGVANTSLYTVNGGAVNVVAAELRADTKTVKLTLDAPITGSFSVTVTNISDAYSHTLDTATATSSVLGYTSEDIGSPYYPGDGFTADNSNIEVVGVGADIWGASDTFRYVYRAVDGDFDARVRVTGLTADAHPISKAVLMARESTLANSVDILTDVNPAASIGGRDQYSSDYRIALGQTTATWGWYYTPAGIPDCWIRLVRLGNEFRAYRSLDGGATWSQTGSNTVAALSHLLIGVGVTSHNVSQAATGTFQGFAVTPPAPDVAVTKTASVSTALVGSTYHYTVTANNQGIANASSVSVSDPLPAGVTYVSSSASAGSASYSAGTVTWNAGALNMGQSATLTITVTAATAGTKVNTATSTTAGDDNSFNDSSSATVVVIQPVQPQLGTPGYNTGTSTFGFSFASEANVPYTIQYATNLTAPISWTTLQTIPGDGTIKTVQDTAATGSQRYYRVLVIP